MKPNSEPRTWMIDTCLPFWGDEGFDDEFGGFVERFDLATGHRDAPMKRVRVQGRQIYVFSHADHLGWADGGAVKALRALDFVKREGWQPGQGWARSLTRDGKLLDSAIDLYDNAFMLFALGWLHRATGEKQIAELARESLLAIRSTLARQDGQGYHPYTDDVTEWVQNPHMHLLEACLALAETTGDEIYVTESKAIAQIFRSKFYDQATQTLAEYFDLDWSRSVGHRGRITEPGHQFEWAWLLTQYKRVTGENMDKEIEGLFKFAETHGIDSHTGLTWAEVRDDGVLLNHNFRTWPQTEVLKARLARLEHGDNSQKQKIQPSIDLIFDNFLDQPNRAQWIDLKDRDMMPIVDKIPASTLYHVFLAFAEAERLRDAWDTST